MGAALTLYGRGEGAEKDIESMITDNNPTIRLGSAYGLGLAYRGSSKMEAVKRLIDLALTDLNKDVQKSCMIAAGLIMYNRPQKVRLCKSTFLHIVKKF